VIIIAAVALATVLSVGFAVNRVSSENEVDPQAMLPPDEPPSVRIHSDDAPTTMIFADEPSQELTPDDSDVETPQSAAHDDDGFFVDILLLDSVDEAASYMPFPIALPSVLPDNAVLSAVNVFPGHPISNWLIRGVTLIYHLELSDELWRSQFVDYAYITLGQSDLLSYLPDIFETPYNSAPSITYVEGVAQETIRIAVGDAEAFITAYNLRVLLEEEPPSADYKVNASITWHRDGILYQLQVFAPHGSISYEQIIAIAESVE